ncbi:Serine/threonine protein kinase [Actinacidiphila yanglinensis]|uniref:Serine/threonine protein kinase n=1 Tax=Actinacidiphila yanglinensis TaxID=310779 RepID=A0A1H6BX17_9ACTN|nr:serine/threonine-protein kinase [Actinacidiphila yanglinensis]SEG65239.1 Serine/threonine protein kinase [Actinacidiphila yanglinensis]
MRAGDTGDNGANGANNVFEPLEEGAPRALGDYRLAARLGAGGMGKVYLSYTPAGRPVAVKVIRPELAEDPEFRQRFRQEVAAAGRVQGLYTAPVLDSDTEGPVPWLATAFVQGPSLAAAVASHGVLPVPTVLLLTAGAAEALQAVHAAGLVHRDLKPSNVLLAADGPRVIDFGIARAADATALTGSGVTVGTPAFMSPEQAAGRKITPATDIFALGAVAAYAAAGAPAFGEGSSHAVLYRIVHEEPDLTGVPDVLRPLVVRCLAKDPAERPGLDEVVAMCRAAAEGGELVRTEQWLPAAVAADITAHHVPARSTTRPDVVTPIPTAPATPASPATAAAPPAPAGPPVPTAPPTPAGPPQDVAGAPTHAAGPQYGGAPTYTTPAYPASTAGYGYPAAAQGRQNPHGPQTPYPGAVPAPGGYGSGPYGSGTHPVGPGTGAGGPGRKKRWLVPAGVLGAVLLLGIALVAVHALNSHKKTGDDASGAQHGTAKATGGGTATSRAPSGTAQPVGPEPETHKGVNLPDSYHLEFADNPLTPKYNNLDDFYYGCDDKCVYGSYNTKLVLLDTGEKGSLEACRADTRYTTQISEARLAAGSQICATTQDGIVALLTYRGHSPSSSPSEYSTFDVTVWRNAVKSDND